MDSLFSRLPTINWVGLPAIERDAARLLSQNLFSLHLELKKFENALDLADYCDWQRQDARALQNDMKHPEWNAAQSVNRAYIEFKQIAVRDAVMTVANFHEVKQAIHGLIGQCPSLLEYQDQQASKKAGRILADAFPDFAKIRFSVAHSGKPFAHPESEKKQRLPHTKTMVIQMLNDRQLTSFVEGKQVSLTLDRTALNALTLATSSMFEAFAPVAYYSQSFV